MIHINKLYVYRRVHTPKFLLIGYIIQEGWSKTIKFSNNNTGKYFMT